MDNVFVPFVTSFEERFGNLVCDELVPAVQRELLAEYERGKEEAQNIERQHYEPLLTGKDAEITALKNEINRLHVGSLWSTAGATAAGAGFGIVLSEIFNK